MAEGGTKHPTRRKFLAITSLVTASGAGAGLWWYHSREGIATESSSLSLATASRKPATGDAVAEAPVDSAVIPLSDHQAFLQNLHSEFKVVTDGTQSVAIRLQEVTPVRRQMVKGVPHESFALFFEGPTTNLLPDVIHRFHHERMGDLEFFLSCYGKSGKTISYQAFFDRAV